MDINEILNNLGLLGSGILLFGMVSGVFWKVDDGFSDEFKEEVALKLLCLDAPNTVRSWPNYFTALFDKLFGEKHLSWKCFFRSSLASFISVIFLTIFASIVSFTFRQDYILGSNIEILTWMIPIGLSCNIIIDYVSLIETRYILTYVQKRKSNIIIIIIIITDLILTCCIYMFLLGSFTAISMYISGGFQSLKIFVKYFLPSFITNPLIVPEGSEMPTAIFFYSTFLTSVWLWLYAISQLLFRLSTKATPIVEKLKHILPIEKRPFRSIGIVCGLIACFFYWVIGLVAKLL